MELSAWKKTTILNIKLQWYKDTVFPTLDKGILIGHSYESM